ncbi:DoxX family membrane protein [Paenibacillus ihumii]|uniref:DoxX family membrane protein n=1 Tax=Paenibacillus ihumii TaxID=687436 RepID=UPI0006D77638|nr:DoxX family membrane protein [Paenibacillus ihumii]
MAKIDFLIKESKAGAVLLFLLRLYLGWKWLTAGWMKLTSSQPFDSTGYLQNAVANSKGDNPIVQYWWGRVLESSVLPNVEVFNFLVPWGEFLIGLALLFGICTLSAALTGMFMNLCFFLSGSISIIPQMLFCAFLLIYAGSNSGRIGVMYLLNRYWLKARTKTIPPQLEQT